MAQTLLYHVSALTAVDVDSMDPTVSARYTKAGVKLHDMTSNQAMVCVEASRSERADILKPPFLLDAEKPPPPGGIAVDCNDEVHVITRMLDERITPDVDRATPLYLVFGIEPADTSGDEYLAAREALEDDGARILADVRGYARSKGMTEVYKMYDASHARQSVEHVAARMDASAIWSPHRMSALDAE